MSIVKRRGANSEALEMLTVLGLRDFAPAYTALGTLLAQLRNSTGTAPVIYSTPPAQTTFPQDPKLSGGSLESSSSAESKSEPYVNNFASKFLETTFLTIGRWVERLCWANPAANTFLFHQYLPCWLSDLVSTKACTSASAKHKYSKQKTMAVYQCLS